MKWLFGLSFFNLGATFICIGQMARVNECHKNMEEAFFLGGAFTLIAAGIVLIGSTITSIGNWFIARRQRRFKASDRLSRDELYDRWKL